MEEFGVDMTGCSWLFIWIVVLKSVRTVFFTDLGYHGFQGKRTVGFSDLDLDFSGLMDSKRDVPRWSFGIWIVISQRMDSFFARY